MNKRTLITAFGVVIILTFVVGTFSVLLYQSKTQATPSPTPEAGQFAGAATADANITALENSLFFECNTTATDPATLAKRVNGITLAYKVSQIGYSAMLSSNASNSTAEELRAVLSPVCDPVILRSARLEFYGKVTLRDLSDYNSTRDIYPVTLNQQSGFVYAEDARVGKTVTMLVYAEMQGDQLTRLAMEEAKKVTPTPSPTASVTPAPLVPINVSMNGTAGNASASPTANVY